MIRADGGVSDGSASGEGSGGAVHLTAQTLSGDGTITAHGGGTGNANHSGGGGGRIRLQTTAARTLPLDRVRAVGGDGYYSDGGHGTVFVLDPGDDRGTLVVDGFGFTQPADSTVLPAGLDLSSLVLRSGVRAVADSGLVVRGALRLEGGSVLSHSSANEGCLVVDAGRVEVAAGSAIDVTGRGYRGGDRSPLPDGQAETLAFFAGAEQGNGGSHGGSGGHYGGAGSRVTNQVYGDIRRPAALGAGGGAWSGHGGDGGGCVRIDADDAVVVDGAVRADGGISNGSASGEGAGGSVWITTRALSGSGVISANGGGTGGANHAGGGGGRVAIDAESVDPDADFADLRGITAFGGDGYYGDGAPGTVHLQLGSSPEGSLVIDAGRTADTWPMETVLPPIGPGTAQAAGPDGLTVDGAVVLPPPGGLAGVRLNPDVSQDETFAIAASDETTITVVTPNENGVEFTSVAAPGATYAGSWRFGSVTVRGGARLTVGDRLAVDGALRVTERSVLAHPETTDRYEGGLVTEAGSVEVEAGSAIDVTGRGHLGGNRSGLEGGVAHTAGFAPGAEAGTGGSHGGLGGKYSGSGSNLPNTVYGDALDPAHLGSGGGAWSGAGGDGGGRIVLTAGSLVCEGAVRAGGALSEGSASGDGSGGTVNLRLGTLSGAGTISADGGSTGGANHVGGAGGRVAVRTTAGRSLPTSAITARGGDGYYGDGEDGSVTILP